MKKILALLLAVMMLLTLTACKSEEQKAADKYLKEMKDLVKDLEKANEDEDMEELMKLAGELMEMAEEGQEIYEDLKDVDEDAADKFQEDVEELMESVEDFS